jgi:beta-lactamase regulating signal transducer with metallopeptidase domain
MISVFTQAVVWLSRWFQVALLAKASVLMVVPLVALKVTKRRRASLRHAILAVTFVSVGLLPLALISEPAIPITVSMKASIPPSGTTFSGTSMTRPMPAAHIPINLNERRGDAAPIWLRTVSLIWMIGALVFVMTLVIGGWRLRQFSRKGLPWIEQSEFVRAIAGELGIRGRVEVLLHEGIVAPLIYGFWRPTVLLPREVSEWGKADLRRSLVHEFQHIRRNDWAIQMLARVVCAMYWFHPLIWISWRKLCLEAERACDDIVVAGGESSEKADYAQQLVRLARRMSNATQGTVLGLANRSDLSQRVSSVLTGMQQRGPTGSAVVAAIAVTGGLLLLAVAPLRVVAQTSSEVKTAHGLALYPGARPKPEEKDEGPHRASLNLDRVSVREASAAKYVTPAHAPEVVAFYRQALQSWGSVTECTGGRNKTVSVQIRPESLEELQVCRPMDFGDGETQLKVGTRDALRIVTVQPVTDGSEFTLVYVGALNPAPAEPTKP